MRLMRIAMTIAVLCLLLPQGHCLRTSPDAKSPEQASKKANEELTQMIREREISKRVADKRIREKEKAAEERANTVEVRVHAGATDPQSKKKEVILRTQISKADLKNKNFSEVRRRAQESRMTYANSRPKEGSATARAAEESADPREESSGNNTLVLMLAGAIGVGGLWYTRRNGAV